MQSNWIGKSYGAEVDFKIKGKNETIKVFTTRPDTLYGATFMVLAPEHTLVTQLSLGTKQEIEVSKFVNKVKQEDKLARTSEKGEKKGVEGRKRKMSKRERKKETAEEKEVQKRQDEEREKEVRKGMEREVKEVKSEKKTETKVGKIENAHE